MSASVRALLLSSCLIVLSAWPCLAQSDTAAVATPELRHFARDRVADIDHLELELLVPSLTDFRLEMLERLTFKPIEEGLEVWTLDAVGLDIRAVTMDGNPVDFVTDGVSLTLRFERPLSSAYERELTIQYLIDRPRKGLHWRPPVPEYQAPGEIHTDADLQGARHWLVLFDEPSERFTFSLEADAPAGYAVVSCGQLVDTEERGERALFRWRQDKAITADQLLLSVGSYETQSGDWQAVPLTCRAPAGVELSAEPIFASLAEMLTFYEDTTGVSYPWDAFQLVAADLTGSAVRIGAGVVEVEGSLLREWLEAGEDFDPRQLSEAVARQWAGALVTPSDWSEQWVTRGLAKYLSCLWIESAQGEDAFTGVMTQLADIVITSHAPNHRLGLVHREWSDPNPLLAQAANPTFKGAWVYHMMRRRLGDERFRLGLREFFAAAGPNGVDTDDIRDAMEAQTGRSLDRLFADYVETPGLPRLELRVGWSDVTTELIVDVRQVAAEGWATPLYEFDLPLVLQHAGETERRLLHIDAWHTNVRLPLPRLPDVVAIDPDMTLLAGRIDSRPPQLWRNQLTQGPTVYSRALAAKSMGPTADYHLRELLATVAADPQEATTVRQAAVAALGANRERHAKKLLIGLAQQGFDSPALRMELVHHISMTLEDEVYELLALHAAADPNAAVAAEALLKLGWREALDYADLARQILRDEQAPARVRRAALAALLAFDDAATLDLALALSRPGAADTQTRAVAIRAAAGLGYRDADTTLAALVEYLRESEPHLQESAAIGLARLGDARGVPELEQLAATARDPVTRVVAEQQLAELEASLHQSTTPEGERIRFLQDRVLEMEAEIQQLREALRQARRDASGA
jgi:aminopeptidase N